MTVRPPSIFTAVNPRDAALDALGHEIAGEKASALGRAGGRVEETLQRLQQNEEPSLRATLVQEAADAVYAYFIQRELMGFRRHQDVIREYGIPGAVLARLGAR